MKPYIRGMDAWLDRAALVVASVTLAIGAALTAVPDRVAAALQLSVGTRGARSLGIVDLVLAAGLFGARPRWPWMALRAGLNAALARHFAVHGRRSPALGMVGLTLVDGAVAAVLARRGR